MNTQAITPDHLSLWDLTMDGGYLMIPLAILLLVSIYVFVERYITIRKASKTDDTFMKRIREYVKEGDVDSARNLCKKTNTPSARLILKGVDRIGRPVNDVQTAIENTGNLEVTALGKGFSWLSTTAAVAPMIGFLGTVTGMIEAFFALAKSGTAANITVLSSGIYQALVTTVAGLVVGILALFAYNFLVSRVNRIMNDMEGKTMEFMDLLNEPAF
jgi:biopolymer transport protein ExbB